MMADMDRNATLRYISGATIQYANTVSKKQPEEKNLKIERNSRRILIHEPANENWGIGGKQKM